MGRTNVVQFEKPDFHRLSSQFTIVDMHFHTSCSDGMNTAQQAAQNALNLGIGIAVTDHNDIRAAVEIEGIKDLFSIPGIEITSREGTHILIYFYDIESIKKFYENDVSPNMGANIMSSLSLSIEQIIIRARAYHTLIILPHPFSAAYTGICNFYFPQPRLDRIFDMVDGIEAINSENLKKWNLKSTVLGFNLSKGMTGGSDGHKIEHMGNAITYAKCSKNRKDFLDAIKNKQSKVIGKEIAMIKKVASNSQKFRTNIGNCPDLLGKNIKYGCEVIQSKSRKVKYNLKQRVKNGKVKKKFAAMAASVFLTGIHYNLLVLAYLLPFVLLK